MLVASGKYAGAPVDREICREKRRPAWRTFNPPNRAVLQGYRAAGVRSCRGTELLPQAPLQASPSSPSARQHRTPEQQRQSRYYPRRDQPVPEEPREGTEYLPGPVEHSDDRVSDPPEVLRRVLVRVHLAVGGDVVAGAISEQLLQARIAFVAKRAKRDRSPRCSR